MNKCPWEKINGFQSPREFERFKQWISEQVDLEKAQEISVNSKLKGPYWHQRWFKHNQSGIVWRLVEPEPPFTGVFEPVNDFSISMGHTHEQTVTSHSRKALTP